MYRKRDKTRKDEAGKQADVRGCRSRIQKVPVVNISQETPVWKMVFKQLLLSISMRMADNLGVVMRRGDS